MHLLRTDLVKGRLGVVGGLKEEEERPVLQHALVAVERKIADDALNWHLTFIRSQNKIKKRKKREKGKKKKKGKKEIGKIERNR